MFQGFSDRTIDFLWGVRFNNNREWIAEHKQDYQNDLMLPLKALANEVYEKMAEKYPDEHFSLHIARIYRDARRCFGKPPLKEELWFSLFCGSERDTARPEFFFGIDPDGYSFGMGFWSARPADMARYRKDMLEHPEKMTAMVERFNAQSLLTLEGPSYTRVTGEVSDLLRPWFVKKHLYLHHVRGYDETCFRHELVDLLVEQFSFMLPYYRHFHWICAQGEQNEKL